MSNLRFWFPLLLMISFYGNSQSLTSVIIDSATQKPIPFVTVQLKDKGVITNEEGRFTFQLDTSIQPIDTLTISCIGYASIKKPLRDFTEPQIEMVAKAIDLNPVIVSNKNYTPEEIIELVEENISNNYYLNYSKKRVFFRETYSSTILKTDYTLRESTIEDLDKAFIDRIIDQVPKKDTRYYESLGDILGGTNAENQKLDLIKASELYDKNSNLDYEVVEERLNKIIKDNVKTDSYFKIKSGLFGTKVDAEEIFDEEIDSTDVDALNKKLEEEKKHKENRKKYFARYKRRLIGKFYENLPILDDTDYNVLFKPGRYELTLDDFTYLGDKAVYVISFTPKRSEEFEGTLYINADDFALIRMDFENVKALRDFSLLGISMKEYLAKGSVIFAKGNNEKYQLNYFDITEGTRAGIRRPLKIIEKNKHVKGRNKQNELSMKIDAAFGSINRYELVIFNERPISNEVFETFKENNNVLPTYMPNYDPEFWKGYDIIEPNQAIKEFTSISTTEE